LQKFVQEEGSNRWSKLCRVLKRKTELGCYDRWLWLKSH